MAGCSAERLTAGRELRDSAASAAAVPALLNQATISAWAARRFCRRLWSSPSTQRLRVKAYQKMGGTSAPEGVHPFVVKKMADQIRKKSIKDLREEQSDLVYLDRCSKQSWEDPEILLEKFLVKVAVGGRK